VSEPVQVMEAFAKIAALGCALGVRDINKLPGCWEHQVDKQWWISLNGHKETIKNSDDFDVPPFHAAIKYNGWPAGLISPAGGVIAAGSRANENTFIAALEAATEQAKRREPQEDR
jgi:hypothetical protein